MWKLSTFFCVSIMSHISERPPNSHKLHVLNMTSSAQWGITGALPTQRPESLGDCHGDHKMFVILIHPEGHLSWDDRALGTKGRRRYDHARSDKTRMSRLTQGHIEVVRASRCAVLIKCGTRGGTLGPTRLGPVLVWSRVRAWGLVGVLCQAAEAENDFKNTHLVGVRKVDGWEEFEWGLDIPDLERQKVERQNKFSWQNDLLLKPEILKSLQNDRRLKPGISYSTTETRDNFQRCLV